MRFALMQEGDCAPGVTIPERYREMVTEAAFAEEMGFDTYCVSEQHFLTETVTVSAPEVFLATIAEHTQTMRLRVTSAVLLEFNHPIRVAERLTTLDVLSGGRAELGTARSNNLQTLQGFGVDPSDTRAQWNESMDVILAALTRETFSHQGKYWHNEPRTLVPKSIQQPHPPIHVSATSEETHRASGERGLGIMTGNSILGWDYAQSCIDAYRDGISRAKPVEGSYVNNSQGFFVAVAHCAESDDAAFREAERVLESFTDFVIWLFSTLGASAPDYAYFTRIEEVKARRADLRFLVESAPYFMVGSPERVTAQLRRLESMGVDQVLLRIDGMGHDVNMASIEAFGEQVIRPFGASVGR